MSRTIIFALFVVVAVAACSALSEGLRELTEAECEKIPRMRWVPTVECGRKLCGSDPSNWNDCLLLYNPGCICERDYFETANGDCVLEKDCPK